MTIAMMTMLSDDGKGGAELSCPEDPDGKIMCGCGLEGQPQCGPVTPKSASRQQYQSVRD